MNTEHFVLNGKKFELKEEDYLFAHIFNALYEPIKLELKQYKCCLDSIKQLDLKQVKKLLRDLENGVPIERLNQQIYHSIQDYIDNPDLEEIGENIEQIFAFGIRRIEDNFEANNNYNISICNIPEYIPQAQKRLALEYYKNLVDKNDQTVKNKSFDECRLEMERDSQSGSIGVWNSATFELHNIFFKEYIELVDTEECDDIKEVAREILKCINNFEKEENRIQFVEKFENECIGWIIDSLHDLRRRFQVPIPIKYCQSENYELFMKRNKVQCLQANESSSESSLNNLFSFPFLSIGYIPVLRSIGDENRELEKMASSLGVDLELEKKKELNRFIAEKVKYNEKDEKEVKGAYNKILDYKKFLGYDQVCETEFLLKEELQKLDVLYRTVNGKIYETREEADDIRSRCFEGKEYESKEQAELVRKEVGDIRNGGNAEDIVEKYRNYQTLSKQEWETKEAKVELEKLKAAIDENYKQMVTKAGQKLESEKKFKQKGIICGIGTGVLLIVDISLGVIAAIVSAVIIFMAYKQIQDCKEANTKVMEMNTEYAKYGEKIIGQENDVNNSMINQNPDELNETCPNCGLPIDKTMKFCPKCGRKLEV